MIAKRVRGHAMQFVPPKTVMGNKVTTRFPNYKYVELGAIELRCCLISDCSIEPRE